MNYKFKGNFGTLVLEVDDNGNASGTYQDGGTLLGTFKEGEFVGEWENKGMEGLVKFTVKEGRLNGKWKKGKTAGAMRGQWWGDQISADAPEKEAAAPKKANDLPDGWGTASAMAALIRHMMLADKKVTDAEMAHMRDAMEYYAEQDIPLREVWDEIDDQMQVYEQVGLHGKILETCSAHLAKTFDEEEVRQFWNILVNITALGGELHYYEYVALQYTTSILMPGVEFSDLVSHMRKNGIAVDDGETIEYDDKYHEAKEIILSEGAALPEILCDVLLIGKNRAERIFDQFERDGIVSPKDENGKRKIIKS
jgi:uncharacterized tellurite resistance protein B-like protein